MFLLMDQFLYTLISNLLIRNFNILQNVSSNSILFSYLLLFLSVQRIQMPLEGLHFVNMLATFGVIMQQIHLICKILLL